MLHKILFFLLIPTLCFAQIPPTGIKDESDAEVKPVFTIRCVGDGIVCTHSGVTGTITVDGSGANPAGNDTEVQFNDGGVLAGDTGMVFNKTTNDFTVLGDGTFSGSGNSEFGAGTKHDAYIITNSAEVQTTDATITVLDTVTLLDENTYHIEAYVVAVQSDGTDRASYHLSVTVYRTSAGGATIQGTVTSVHTQESNASLAATFTVSSNDIRVSVTGIAAETWEWGSTLRYINMSN